MTKRTKQGMVMIAIYVDDFLFVGNENLIKETIQGIVKWGLNVKIEDDLSDYLSCTTVFNKNKTKAWLGQPHMVRKIADKFGDMVQNLQTYRTPGTPNQGIIRAPKGGIVEKVDPADHSLYRTGVGMLLFLVKHSRPDIANAVRELSKVLDGPSPAAMKEMKRVIKYVLDTKHYGLKIEPEKLKEDKWVLRVFTDSDWAGDKDNRLSVSGYVLFLMNVPILWKSKAQKLLALSSSEAEYYALSEAAKDVKFVHMLLITMGMKVELPIIVKVDNVGAIFMTENISTAGRTKHLDLRARYVNNLVEDGFMTFEFVRSNQNKADHLTKNVSGEIYEAHVHDFVTNKEAMIENSEVGEVCMMASEATNMNVKTEEDDDDNCDLMDDIKCIGLNPTVAESQSVDVARSQQKIPERNISRNVMVNQSDSTFLTFIWEIATKDRKIKASQISIWVKKVYKKFVKIGIDSVEEVV
jgi:uncharacterized protein YdaT